MQQIYNINRPLFNYIIDPDNYIQNLDRKNIKSYRHKDFFTNPLHLIYSKYNPISNIDIYVSGMTYYNGYLDSDKGFLHWIKSSGTFKKLLLDNDFNLSDFLIHQTDHNGDIDFNDVENFYNDQDDGGILQHYMYWKYYNSTIFTILLENCDRNDFELLNDVLEKHNDQLRSIYSVSNKNQFKKDFEYAQKYKYRLEHNPKDAEELKDFYKKEQKKINKENKMLDEIIDILVEQEELSKDEIEALNRKLVEATKSNNKEEIKNAVATSMSTPQAQRLRVGSTPRPQSTNKAQAIISVGMRRATHTLG